MKKLFATLILLLPLFLSQLKAEVINNIEINGNKRISAETIKVYGQIKPLNSDFSNADINNIIRNLYETNFFEDIDISIKNKTLIINLVEYPLINQIIIIGEPNSRVKKQIKDVISLKEKILLFLII